MPLGKCGGCGNHPRSKLHIEQCGAGPKTKEEPVDLFVKGSTCIGCHTTYTVTPFPPFQEPDAKHGQYDVTRQLPRCSKDFPLCARCLPWHWRGEARRTGMVEEVKEVYA
jgi:hypothetical protein